MEEVRKNVLNKVLSYAEIINKEYEIDKEKYNYLKQNIDDLVRYDNRTISFFVDNGILYLPAISFDIFDILKKDKHYNTTKNSGVLRKNYLDNNYTYSDYINIVIRDGYDVLDYFLDSLLHEVMHMLGGNGATPLTEGINELKTRELATKYNIKIAAIGYQKEVGIAKKLQQIFGKETFDKIEFMNYNETQKYLASNYKDEEVELFFNVYHTMVEEGKTYINELSKIKNPYDKAKVYDSVEYTSSNLLIDNYLNKHTKRRD